MCCFMRGGWRKWCSGMSITTTMNIITTTTTFISPEFLPWQGHLSTLQAPQNPARPAVKDCSELPPQTLCSAALQGLCGGHRTSGGEGQLSAEAILTSVIKMLIRHVEVCIRMAIQGHSMARTEDHIWGSSGHTDN